MVVSELPSQVGYLGPRVHSQCVEVRWPRIHLGDQARPPGKWADLLAVICTVAACLTGYSNAPWGSVLVGYVGHTPSALHKDGMWDPFPARS